jgi:nicotinamidase-related amidase
MKSVYLVLDMQNDLVSEDGPNGKSPLGALVRERAILEKTAAAIAKARAAGLAIGFVRRATPSARRIRRSSRRHAPTTSSSSAPGAPRSTRSSASRRATGSSPSTA